MNNKKFYLYGLYCPIYNDLKYIGITTGSLKSRLNAHLKKPTNLYIKNWFEELQEKV
jgi:predicted GIY-YIG superfamily endonuclease